MKFGAVGIIASNIEKSLEFYRLLGVKFKPEGGDQHYEALTASGIRLMMDSEELVKSFNPSWQNQNENRQSPRVALAFEASSPTEVDETVERVRSHSFEIEKEPWDTFWGQRYSVIKDPDGNQIDLFANLS